MKHHMINILLRFEMMFHTLASQPPEWGGGFKATPSCFDISDQDQMLFTELTQIDSHQPVCQIHRVFLYWHLSARHTSAPWAARNDGSYEHSLLDAMPVH